MVSTRGFQHQPVQQWMVEIGEFKQAYVGSDLEQELEIGSMPMSIIAYPTPLTNK
jgi:hypothetical protein